MKFPRIIAAAVIALASLIGHAQKVTSGGLLDFGTATTTGQLGNYYAFDLGRIPLTFTVSWSVQGTAPSACTFNAEGSLDGTNWFYLESASGISCTASGMEAITYKPVRYLRIHVLTYTAATGSNGVLFKYAG